MNNDFEAARDYADKLQTLLVRHEVHVVPTERGGFDVPLDAQRNPKYARVSGKVLVTCDGKVDAHLFLRDARTKAHLDGEFSYWGDASGAPQIEQVEAKLNLEYLTIGPTPVRRAEPVFTGF